MEYSDLNELEKIGLIFVTGFIARDSIENYKLEEEKSDFREFKNKN